MYVHVMSSLSPRPKKLKSLNLNGLFLGYLFSYLNLCHLYMFLTFLVSSGEPTNPSSNFVYDHARFVRQRWARAWWTEAGTCVRIGWDPHCAPRRHLSSLSVPQKYSPPVVDLKDALLLTNSAPLRAPNMPSWPRRDPQRCHSVNASHLHISIVLSLIMQLSCMQLSDIFIWTRCILSVYRM